MPDSTPPRGRLGRGTPTGDRPVDQPPHVRFDHDFRHLQRAVADRAVLQGAQTDAESEDLRGDEPERVAHPDLDSSHRDVASEMDASPLQAQLVLLQPGRPAAHQPLYPSRFDGVAPKSLPRRTRGAGIAPTLSAVGDSWTAV